MNYKEQLKELRAWDGRKEEAVEQSLELRKELERAGENLEWWQSLLEEVKDE